MKFTCWVTAIFLASCTLPEEKEVPLVSVSTDTAHLQTSGTYAATAAIDPLPIKQPRKVKSPSGIYHGILPLYERIVQTIAFYPDHTFQLQEEYMVNKKDSTAVTSGNWSPSDGFIWLYKDQVVRGRYQWKGDTLQYFNPSSKKGFSLNPRSDIMENQTWQKKKSQGIAFSGIGNEPFWSVQYVQDSVEFSLSDWKEPIHLKVNQMVNTPDSTLYIAQKDSTELTITVYPFFCSDGMSDFVYRNKVRVQYNNQVYHGCGVKFH